MSGTTWFKSDQRFGSGKVYTQNLGLHLSDFLLFLGFPLSSGYSCAQLCPLVLQARKIMSVCFDYFSLNHHIKLWLVISHKSRKFAPCNFLLQSLATPLASAWFVFHSSESSDCFYFFLYGFVQNFQSLPERRLVW